MGISWPRLALLVVAGWWTLRSGFAEKWVFIDFVNLAFHEAGHLFLSFAGSTIMFLGGTIGQLLVPVSLAVYFLLRRQQPFGSAFCLWWAGQSLVNVSVYMADARELALPLVGGGDHDWNELFFRWGLLAEPSVERVSNTTWAAGMVVMLLGLAWIGYFVMPEDSREDIRARLTARWPWLDPALES